jgi:hypothetical protein
MVSTREKKKVMVKNSFFDSLLQQMQHRQVACSQKQKKIVTNETMIMENYFQVLIC